MANTVKRPQKAPARPVEPGAGTLYTQDRGRKYTNQSERIRFLGAALTIPPLYSLFARFVAWTGPRISEALAVTPNSFQIDECKVAFVTLKQRKFVVREVPLSKGLMRDLDRFFSLRERQRDPLLANRRCWTFSRVTAWKIVKDAMEVADVHGPQACPKGLRHGFAIAMLHKGVGINKIKCYLGHARLSTTEIYLNVSGPEERALLARFWKSGPSLRFVLLGWFIAAKRRWSRVAVGLPFSISKWRLGDQRLDAI